MMHVRQRARMMSALTIGTVTRYRSIPSFINRSKSFIRLLPSSESHISLSHISHDDDDCLTRRYITMKNLTTVILLYLTLLALCLGSEIFVGVEGVDSPECGATFNTSCASITYALGLAVPNDIIILLPGTYNFSSVVISKQNITIRSMYSSLSQPINRSLSR